MPLADRRPENAPFRLLLALVPFVLVLGLHRAIGSDVRDVAASLGDGAAWGSVLVLGLLVGASPLIARVYRRSYRDTSGPYGDAVPAGSRPPAPAALWTALGLCGLFVLLTSLAAKIHLLPVFAALEWNWPGKLLDLAWVGLLLAAYPRWARDEVGLRTRLEPGSWRPALVLTLGVFFLFLGLTILSVGAGWAPADDVDAERLAFDLTIPNLTEELIWRGLLFAALARAVLPRRRVLGARVGWEVVIPAIAFGFAHTALLDRAGVWSLDIGNGIFALAMGLAMGWVRARTGSIWPAFALHCAPEVGMDLGSLVA